MKNSTDKFLETLEDVCFDLGKIPNINYGGCGFTAKFLAEQLTPILGKENVKIRYTCSPEDKLLTKIKKENFLTKLTLSFFINTRPFILYGLNSHIVCTVKYKNVWYVLEGGAVTRYLKNYEEKLSTDSFEIEELENFLKYKKFWNSSYNRSNNKKIKNVLNKYFKENLNVSNNPISI